MLCLLLLEMVMSVVVFSFLARFEDFAIFPTEQMRCVLYRIRNTAVSIGPFRVGFGMLEPLV